MYGDNSDMLTPAIIMKPKKDVDIDEFKATVSQKLRTFRGLRPDEMNNFFISNLFF